MALLMGLALIGSFLSVLFHVTTVVGGSFWLGSVVVAALGLGVLMAGVAGPRTGVAALVALFGLGLGGYLMAIPDLYEALVSLELVVDTVALLLGDMSLLQLFRADLWAVLMAPAPVYGTWYLLLRRQYSLGVWVGGAALLFVVLTGDASETVTLVGATSALGVLGFGTLEQSEGSWQRMREVGLLLVGVVILTRLSRPVFGHLFPRTTGSGRQGAGEAGLPTLEGNLIGTSGQFAIQGSISLSPAVRFTVTADEPGRWHTGAFDRFTGRGWARTGMETPYAEPLPRPFGRTSTLEQRFTAESSVTAMPAAWRPVNVDGAVAARTRVTELGGLQAAEPLEAGDTYWVRSERPVWTEAQLKRVGGEVPAFIRRRYLQLPADTPDRIGRFTAELTRDAENRYERAVRVLQWLTAVKGYSLDIDRPPGDVADAFIFEMDRGYCVYFATAMVVMLRTLDIPARLAVGYTAGQPVGDRQWEIRGLNSHAWVQVYFDQFGWVSFDPTPSGPREAARNRRLVSRGESPGSGAAGEGSGAGASTPTPSPTPAEPESSGDESSAPTPIGADGSTPELFEAEQPVGPFTPPPPTAGRDPTRRSLITGLSDTDRLAVLAGSVGVVLGLSRLGLLALVTREFSIRWQLPTDSPQQDIERAFERLERVLAHRHPTRAANETRRSYLESLRRSGVDDDRLHRILDRYERARYQGEVSRERADEVIALVDAYVRDYHSVGASMQRFLS